VSGEQ